MSTSSAVARMLTLVPWLIERPGASLGEAAQAFGVSATQIRKDLGHLDFCGLPGLGGGDLFDVEIVGDRVVISMAEELRRPMRPTPTEAMRLVLTLEVVVDALGDDLPHLRSALSKVRDAVGVTTPIADVQEMDQHEEIALLREAVSLGRRVSLLYHGRADERPRARLVEPWALRLDRGRWYLQGLDVEAAGVRTFRLDRALEIALTGEPVSFELPTDLPAPIYMADDEDLALEIRTSPRGRWLLDAVAHDDFNEEPDGGVTIRLHTDAPEWIVRLIFMAGGEAWVVRPSHLREQVTRRASEALLDGPSLESVSAP